MNEVVRRCAGLLVTSLATAALLWPLPAMAQAQRVLTQPPSALLTGVPGEEDAVPAAVPSFQSFLPLPARPIGAEVSYDLKINYVVGSLYNPVTQTDDTVRLRAYTGSASSIGAPFAAPTVDIWPGETFRLTLDNQLEADPSCPGGGGINVPHCFNSTNMHTHGLWVSPTGNGDNVLISINPGVAFQYEYNIPADHPAGTFWYHSHRHGSTALQVSSGMAGALIVHGDRVPIERPDGSWAPGDIDVLLKDAEGAPLRERILLFQQIAYACRETPDGPIKENPDGTWRCDTGDTGSVEDYDQLGRTSWEDSGRFTSINGIVLPTMTEAASGVPERWRMIHGGVRDTIKVVIRKMESAGGDVSSQAALPGDRGAFVEGNCTGEPITTLGLAADGLTREQLNARTATVLQPGYREDLFVVFPEPGTYCVIDGSLPPSQTVNIQAHGREVLALVQVGGTATTMPPAAIAAKLLKAAAAELPVAARTKVLAELEDGLHLTSFTKHKTIEPNELTGTQSLGFLIGAGGFQIGELNGGPSGPFTIKDPAPYDPARIDRNLTLGNVEEWTLTSFLANHPFHIHINPFQIVEVLNPNGVDVSGPGDATVEQFANLKGVWKDTMFVPQGYVVRFRTRYERYIGNFVLHCHILDHEDQGMMQNVRISIPGGGLPTGHVH